VVPTLEEKEALSTVVIISGTSWGDASLTEKSCGSGSEEGIKSECD